MAEAKFREIKFSDQDVVGLSDWIPAGEYNPLGVRPWLLHDHGFVLCVVFASNLQDALDAAVDAGKLDHFQLNIKDLIDYGERGEDIVYLGNANAPFDIEPLGIEELPNPPASFVAQFNAMS